MSHRSQQQSALILAVQALLQNKTVGTQAEIKTALQKQGFVVNQVKISRVLHKIGAIKMQEGSQIVYRLPTELVSITANDPVKHLILSIIHNEVMIVVKTAPGCAQFVARLLDQSKEIAILGTVAGDDAIFIAPEKIQQIKKIHKKISDILLR